MSGIIGDFYVSWYTDYTLIVEIDSGDVDLQNLQKTFKNEKVADKVTEICVKLTVI